eukprot:5678737-Prymnesium_polylepis.1
MTRTWTSTCDIVHLVVRCIEEGAGWVGGHVLTMLGPSHCAIGGRGRDLRCPPPQKRIQKTPTRSNVNVNASNDTLVEEIATVTPNRTAVWGEAQFKVSGCDGTNNIDLLPHELVLKMVVMLDNKAVRLTMHVTLGTKQCGQHASNAMACARQLPRGVEA